LVAVTWPASAAATRYEAENATISQGVVEANHLNVGYQCAGIISEVGARVSNHQVGDRVVAIAPDGANAERVAASARTVWHVPKDMDLTLAACIPVAFATAHEALFALGELARGQNVLVHAGAGGVGLAAVQFAHAAGAFVLTTASSEEKLARLRDFGAGHGINYRTSSFVDEVTKVVGPDGVDLVIDPVGGSTLQHSVLCLKYRGKIVNIGLSGRDETLFNPVPLWGRNGALIGLGAPIALTHEYPRAYDVIARCIQRVRRGDLSVVIDRRFALADAAKAHAYIEERTAFGRVVLLPRG